MTDALLYIKTIADTGEHITRYWHRTQRVWTPHRAICEGTGYKTMSTAQGQLTRLEKTDLTMPPGETRYELGCFNAAHPKYKGVNP